MLYTYESVEHGDGDGDEESGEEELNLLVEQRLIANIQSVVEIPGDVGEGHAHARVEQGEGSDAEEGVAGGGVLSEEGRGDLEEGPQLLGGEGQVDAGGRGAAGR